MVCIHTSSLVYLCLFLFSLFFLERGLEQSPEIMEFVSSNNWNFIIQLNSLIPTKIVCFHTSGDLLSYLFVLFHVENG